MGIGIKLQPNPGQIVVWGDNSAGQIRDTPAGNDFKTIAAGGNIQSLAIRENGSLRLWSTPAGNNVADPNTSIGTDSPQIPAGVSFIDAVLSVTHGLAVADDGTLYPFGTLAIPELNPKPKSIVPTGLKVDKDLANNGHCVAAGGGFCVVIDKNQSLCQWTVEEIGTTKTYKTTEILVPAGKFKKVAARNDYVIAISEEGDLYGWGPPFDAMWDAPSGLKYLALWERKKIRPFSYFYYLRGQIGDPYVDLAAGNVRRLPAFPGPPEPDRDGLRDPVPHFLALSQGGVVYGFGKNNDQEATGAPAVLYQAIAAGSSFSIGLDREGHVHHWGSAEPLGPQPQSGTKPPPLSANPGLPRINDLSKVPTGFFKAIGASAHHAVALGGDGGVEAEKPIPKVSDLVRVDVPEKRGLPSR